MSAPEWDVKPQDWGLSDEATMSCEDGLVENHEYADLRGMTLEDYQDWRRWEDALLAWGGEPYSDEGLDRSADFEPAGWLDPGVGTTVIALSVIGGCPVTSCNGTHEGAYEQHPLVFAWLPATCEPMVRAAAESAGVNVMGDPVRGLSGILIWTDKELAPMRAFAEKLIELWTANNEGPKAAGISRL